MCFGFNAFHTPHSTLRTPQQIVLSPYFPVPLSVLLDHRNLFLGSWLCIPSAHPPVLVCVHTHDRAIAAAYIVRPWLSAFSALCSHGEC